LGVEKTVVEDVDFDDELGFMRPSSCTSSRF